MPAQPGAMQDQVGAVSTPPQGQGQPTTAPLATATRAYVPHFTTEHLNAMAPGESVDTPMGTVTRGPDGAPHILLSDQGKAHYAQLQAQEVQKYGDHPFKGLPGAPQPQFTPGRPHFNPFSGTWSDGWSGNGGGMTQ